jgi:hypothetical protein
MCSRGDQLTRTPSTCHQRLAEKRSRTWPRVQLTTQVRVSLCEPSRIYLHGGMISVQLTTQVRVSLCEHHDNSTWCRRMQMRDCVNTMRIYLHGGMISVQLTTQVRVSLCEHHDNSTWCRRMQMRDCVNTMRILPAWWHDQRAAVNTSKRE